MTAGRTRVLLGALLVLLACEARQSIDGAIDTALTARVDQALAAADHCAAADAYLQLAAAHEQNAQWAECLEASERGIDVWRVASALWFLEREATLASETGQHALAAEFTVKVEEAMAGAALWLPPSDDPKCDLSPPTVDLVSARITAIRAAIAVSDYDSASRHLDVLSSEIGHAAHATDEQIEEIRSLREAWKASRGAV